MEVRLRCFGRFSVVVAVDVDVSPPPRYSSLRWCRDEDSLLLLLLLPLLLFCDRRGSATVAAAAAALPLVLTLQLEGGVGVLLTLD